MVLESLDLVVDLVVERKNREINSGIYGGSTMLRWGFLRGEDGREVLEKKGPGRQVWTS